MQYSIVRILCIPQLWCIGSLVFSIGTLAYAQSKTVLPLPKPAQTQMFTNELFPPATVGTPQSPQTQYNNLIRVFMRPAQVNIPASLLNERKLSAAQRQRLSFMQAVQAKKWDQAQNIARNWSTQARIGANLVIITRNPHHRASLVSLGADALRLNEAQRQSVALILSNHIARHKAYSWTKLPFSTRIFNGLDINYAVQERIAQAQLASKNVKAAKVIYQGLSRSFSGRAEGMEFDQILIALEKRDYARTKNSRPLESLLSTLRTRYSTQETMKNYVEREYQSLAANAVSAADRAPKDRNLRLQAIGVVGRFVDNVSNEATQQSYQATQARLYAADGQHRRAVTIYMDLALNGLSANRERNLNLAIKSQHQLAGIAEGNPWQIYRGKRSSNETLSLLQMYEKMLEIYGSRLDWSLHSHIGMLRILAQQSEGAYTLWQDSITKSPRHPYATNAAEYMLNDFQQRRAWSRLEDIARLALRVGVTPSRARSALGSALYFGGKDQLAQGNYAEAAKKLAEFCSNYRLHPQRDDALFSLAAAYRGTGQHFDNIKVLEQLTKEHPMSKLIAAAYLQGGESAQAMALEEFAIYFYQGYLRRVSSGERALQVADELVDLYLGRELYAEAIAVYRGQINQRNLSNSQKLKAAGGWLDLEERNINYANAAMAAQAILGLNPDATLRARAQAALARNYLQRKDQKKFAATLAELTKTAAGSIDAQEFLGEIRYLAANAQAAQTRPEISNLELRDPLATLNKEYQHYLKVKASFDSVCQSGVTSYCAPAMSRIAAVADATVPRLDTITIVETLEQSIVNQFNARKEQVLNGLADDNLNYLKGSYTKMIEGHTRPDYTEQILWENSSDWNFDRISGETGNGYIQFEPKQSAGG